MRLLVVDDYDDCRQVVADLLRIEGHEVCLASSRDEAFEIIEAGERVEGAILDYCCPQHGDGLVVARELERRGVPRECIRVVTGSSDEELKACGFTVMRKPVDSASLLAVFAR